MAKITVLSILLLHLVAACSIRTSPPPIHGLADIAQDAGMYHGLKPDTPLLSEERQQAAYRQFMEVHFSPWARTSPKYSAEEAFWGFDAYETKTLYGENTLARSAAWMEQMRDCSRVDHYPSMGRKAIAVVNTSMRVFPTNRPAFQDFSHPGEGYPFDYIQNSLILAGTPLYATHISADQAWVLVESRFAFGWVPATDIGWVDDAFTATFKDGTFAAITRDDVPIVDTHGQFRFTGHVGTILPIQKEKATSDRLALIIPARNIRGEAIPHVAFVRKTDAEQAPLRATPENFARLIDAMLGRQYGWGGMYEDRDCSATTMDLMASFGIFLPRNSSQQIKVGTLASMEGMSREAKKQFIRNTATPFLTLVRKPGHIMLYIGEKDGEPIVFHSVWGLKTKHGKKYGRRVIGGAVITTLEPDLPDLARPEGIWLNSVQSISTLPASFVH